MEKKKSREFSSAWSFVMHGKAHSGNLNPFDQYCIMSECIKSIGSIITAAFEGRGLTDIEKILKHRLSLERKDCVAGVRRVSENLDKSSLEKIGPMSLVKAGILHEEESNGNFREVLLLITSFGNFLILDIRYNKVPTEKSASDSRDPDAKVIDEVVYSVKACWESTDSEAFTDTLLPFLEKKPAIFTNFMQYVLDPLTHFLSRKEEELKKIREKVAPWEKCLARLSFPGHS